MRTVRATRYVAPLREGGSLPGLVEGDHSSSTAAPTASCRRASPSTHSVWPRSTPAATLARLFDALVA